MPASSTELKCIFFPDLTRWERRYFEQIVDGLSAWHRIEKVDIWESNRHWKDTSKTANYWVLSHDWKRALSTLTLPGKGPIHVSILGLKPSTSSLIKLLWRRRPRYHSRLQLLAHSPLNFRFHSEIEKVKGQRLAYLPLPLVNSEPMLAPKPRGDKMVVGTFAPFSSENNLNYFFSVAHYVLHKRTDVMFRVIGAGPLYHHLYRMTREMGLEGRVEVAEVESLEEANDFDAFLFVPLRNDHFLPIFEMARRTVPVVASEIPGVEAFIVDNKSGFLVPPHNIQVMGDHVLRLLDSAELRAAIGNELKSSMESAFSLERLRSFYENSLFGGPDQKYNALSPTYPRAA